jgi:hypothetical protein
VKYSVGETNGVDGGKHVRHHLKREGSYTGIFVDVDSTGRARLGPIMCWPDFNEIGGPHWDSLDAALAALENWEDPHPAFQKRYSKG